MNQTQCDSYLWLLFLSIHMCIYISTVHTHMYIYMYIYIYLYTYIDTYIHTYIHIYTCIKRIYRLIWIKPNAIPIYGYFSCPPFSSCPYIYIYVYNIHIHILMMMMMMMFTYVNYKRKVLKNLFSTYKTYRVIWIKPNAIPIYGYFFCPPVSSFPYIYMYIDIHIFVYLYTNICISIYTSIYI
jgi:hypothetical protein